jgi:predicted glycogen debranching enzyme
MLSVSDLSLTPSCAKNAEWLVSNGRGGYASSTAIGMNTRKYHGLLVVPLRSGAGRHVMLSKFEEIATLGGQEFPFSTNAYPGTVFPTGYKFQTGFSFGEHPVFSFAFGDCRLQKSVRMLRGKDAVVVSYKVSGREAKLRIRPLLSPRAMHEDPPQDPAQLHFESDRFGFSISKPSYMRASCSEGKFFPSCDKYHNMVYPVEQERGYAAQETLLSPGYFEASLSPGEELHIACSLEGLTTSEALEILDRQAMRNRHLLSSYSQANGIERTDFSDILLRAADSFVFSRNGKRGINAGYHWFSQWGRDTFVSLPGLLLATGRAGMAREVFQSWAPKMKEGLLPNAIDEQGKASYASSDAALWFVNAAREYLEWTDDRHFIMQELWKPMKGWLSATIRGNSLLSMESDSLLSVKSPSSTWMDAQVDGKAVTPRSGKAVEINALWYSNLCFMREMAEEIEDERVHETCSQLSEEVEENFQDFLSASDGALLDTIAPNDASVRPNQIFAISLPHSPLKGLQQKHIFNAVRSELYTPLGLRTLSPRDRRFCESYGGDEAKRASAYHQGMVWPWLLGAFYDAQLKVYPGTESYVLSSLRPFADALGKGCIGSLPEMYQPKDMSPAGAISQAWSVAEVLRIYTKVKRAAVRTMSGERKAVAAVQER